jgi:hypothetical protein
MSTGRTWWGSARTSRRAWRSFATIRSPPPWDLAFPLYEAGISKSDVLSFWATQPFDLHLREWEGNCDLCFLKGAAKRRRIMRDTPDLAAKWIEDEALIGATFNKNAPSYAALFRQVQRQPELEFGPPACDVDDLGDCFCTD